MHILVFPMLPIFFLRKYVHSLKQVTENPSPIIFHSDTVAWLNKSNRHKYALWEETKDAVFLSLKEYFFKQRKTWPLWEKRGDIFRCGLKNSGLRLRR